MKRIFLVFLSVMLVGCGSAAPGGKPASKLDFDVTDQSQLSQQQADMYRKAAGDIAVNLLGEEGNVAISPLSIYTAMSMAAMGAEGETAAQLFGLLGCTDKAQLADINQRMLNMMNSNDKALCVNSVWLQKDMDVYREYIGAMEKYFYAETQRVDFSQGAAAKINSWVKKNTKGLLESKVTDNPDRLCMLVNATWLKDSWDGVKFHASDTQQKDFHGSDGTGSVQMMSTHADVELWEDTGFRSISIPMKEAGQMVFVLPAEGADPLQLIKDVGLDDLLSLEDTPVKHSLDIQIPRFDVSNHLSLFEGLQDAGVSDAFDPLLADFSSIAGNEENPSGLFISDVLHGARVSVDEEGVTAAAYTYPEMDEAAAVVDEIEPFILDRPFAFALVREGLPLFVGVIRSADMGS